MNFLRYSITWRRLLHKPIIWLMSKGHHFLRKNNVKLIKHNFKRNGKPTIYVATHVFYEDVHCVLASIQESAFLLLGAGGDEHERKKSMNILDKIGSWVIGSIHVDRSNKTSKQAALDKMISVLKNNGNILIFPEGSWNMTPCLPVKKLHWGLLEIAEKADANIVPVAVGHVNNDFCVSVGALFNYTQHDTKAKQIIALRDMMATLVWEMIEMNPQVKREDIDDNYWLAHVEKNVKQMPWESLEEEESYDFKPKGELSIGELLAEMHGIKYKSMAVDYKTYKHIDKLVDNWNRPIKFNTKWFIS